MSGTSDAIQTASTAETHNPVKLSEVPDYDKLQWLMERAHNAFKLGHESMLKHLENPPLDDLPNFLGYCNSWASIIIGHHDTEELLLFPFLSKHLDMGGEIGQHKVMHDHLDGLLEYVKDPNTLKTFSADVLRGKLEALREPFFTHLDEELVHISGSNLRPHFTLESLDNIILAIDKHAQGSADPFTELPFMVSHIAPPYRGNFPELPWFLRTVVIPIVACRFAGRWKYSPYSAFSVV